MIKTILIIEDDTDLRKYLIRTLIDTGFSVVDIADGVRGLNVGADDYITKPFKEEELIARIRARLRPAAEESGILKVADLELNPETFEVKRGGNIIQLSHKEYELLHYLMINSKRVLSRDMILQRIWMTADYIERRVVDVYIGYLRKKIDGKSKIPLIHTIRGFGYVLKND